MANTKISALTSATTPLAGTEVLPIVQSSTTVKVAVSDLTAGRSISVSGLTNTGLTASKPVFTDASKVLTSTGVVPVANGGTNLTSFTSGGVVYASSSSALATGSALVFDGTNFSTTGTIKGSTTIGVGNATPSASGAGITFPAAISASSDANTLDDYEEGTFTPTITSGSGAITSYTATGAYTKIGRAVTIAVTVTINNPGTASGTMKYTLPFTQVSTPFFTAPVREYNATGIWYFTEIDNSGGTIWTSINGGVVWSSTYNYTWSITYFTT